MPMESSVGFHAGSHAALKPSAMIRMSSRARMPNGSWYVSGRRNPSKDGALNPSSAVAAAPSRAAASTESAGRLRRSAARAATSWIVSPSGTVKRTASPRPAASTLSTRQTETPGLNS